MQIAAYNLVGDTTLWDREFDYFEKEYHNTPDGLENGWIDLPLGSYIRMKTPFLKEYWRYNSWEGRHDVPTKLQEEREK